MGCCWGDRTSRHLGLVPLTGMGMGPIFPVVPRGCFLVLGVASSHVSVAIPLSELWVVGFSSRFVVKLLF